MNRRRSQHGFALILVLVLVLLASVALAGAARHSTTLAIEAVNREHRLQRDWATRTLGATLLPHAERLLDEAERGTAADPTVRVYANSPLPQRYVECELAGMRYELVITDEQSRLNVNRLRADRERSALMVDLREAISEAGAAGPGEWELRLREQVGVEPEAEPALDTPDSETPIAAGETTGDVTSTVPVFGGFGQVFDGASPADLLGTRTEPGPATVVTLWGDGKLNIRRASPDAIVRLCEEATGADWVRPLADAVAADPYQTLSAAMQGIHDLEPADKNQVRGYLTDSSSCHGLWVVAHGPQRAWYTLLVAESLAPAAPTDDDTPYNPWRTLIGRYEIAW